jgi:nitroimidazol reductase NimA-like FMN-containing flavoprotein (pyridoxamine 5'-phosphate oxidase superfamily)
MGEAQDSPVVELVEAECWQLLRWARVGRLAVCVDGQPDIFPVNFIVDGRAILFRTTQGTKSVSIALNRDVAFEADGWTDEELWSVVVRGGADELANKNAIARAEGLPLRSWTPVPKDTYIRISPRMVSGRRIRRGREQPRFAE